MLELIKTDKIFGLDDNGASVVYELLLKGRPSGLPYYFDKSEKQYRSNCCHWHNEVAPLFSLKCSDFRDRLSMQVAYLEHELRTGISCIRFTRKKNILSLVFELFLNDDSAGDLIWNFKIYLKTLRYEAKKAGYKVGNFKIYEDDNLAVATTITFDFQVEGSINQKLEEALAIYDVCDRHAIQRLLKRAKL